MQKKAAVQVKNLYSGFFPLAYKNKKGSDRCPQVCYTTKDRIPTRHLEEIQ